ncbi:TPA: hypothetical protein R4S70_004721 [Raoultella ornithinolytica]|uniref:hypothetical protein n=1 Tax=Raoultella ornithinolytica TaxID=54291 RepID=UPI0006613FF8|nr:hypothetical protein [Raoultella ornithinolytica]HED1507135.1 hypothetical protein [Raoultella ornithinolytica]
MKFIMSKRVFLNKIISALTLLPVFTTADAVASIDRSDMPKKNSLTVDEIGKYIPSFIGECIFLEKRNSSTDEFFFSADFFISIPSVSNDLIDNVIYLKGVNCSWKRRLQDCIFVSWFGAKGDGVQDDTEAIAKANIAAHKEFLPLHFVPGLKYLVSKSYEIDVAKTSWFSNGLSTLKWIDGFNEDFAIRLFSSQEVYSQRFQNIKIAMKGLALIGGGITRLFKSAALRIGGDERNSSLFTVCSIAIQGWATAILFDNNSWRIKFSDCQFLWGNILASSDNKNSGECMVFDNCMFADNRSYTELHYGDWFFSKCSFDNHEIKVFGDSNVFVDQSHMENPGRKSPDFTILSVNSIDCSASVVDSFVFISPTPKIINTPLFYVVDGNNKGLYLRNLQFKSTKNYNPSLGTEHALVLVGGEGKSVLENIRVSFDDKSYIALNKNNSSVLMNSRFQNGLRYWEFNDGVSYNKGYAKGLSDVISFSKNEAKISQSVSLRGSGVLTGGLMVNVISGELRLTLECFDSFGNVISTREWYCLASQYKQWSWLRIGEELPGNIFKINFFCEGLGQSVNIQIRNILMDIIA